MAKMEMRDQLHLWIQFKPYAGDLREIIIDEEKKDIRVCDGKAVIKIVFDKNNKIAGVLVNDVFVWQPSPGKTLR